jgi:hypothetical protein
VSDLVRWAVARTDLRVKAAVLIGALPFGAAVAVLMVVVDAGGVVAAAGAIGATGLVLGAAGWLLAPRAAHPAALRVERIRAAERVLPLAVESSAPLRANMVIPIIDLPHFFGGYLGLFNLARRLSERGTRLRIVTADRQPRLPPDWRQQIERYEGLHGIFDRIEVEFSGDGSRALEVSPHDSFVAVSAWTAAVAHRASRMVGRERFVHVIQDYDPLMLPHGSLAAVARNAYEAPHYAVFSTQPLSNYFRVHRLGVFADGVANGERNSAIFRNAITPVGPVDESELAGRPRRSLLFYARPEAHAARNMFELGVVAIARAFEEGLLEGSWHLAGIGSVTPLPPVALPGGRRLDLLPRMAQAEYGQTLRGFSVGLALMDSPHPSLVPIEMASAGLATVTSTFENKDAAELSVISANLIPAKPTVADLATALGSAARRTEDPAARARSADVAWPKSWDEAFDESVLARIGTWLIKG